MFRTTRLWIALCALWVALAPLASAAVRVTVLSDAKEASPGGVVTHVFAVTVDDLAAGVAALAAAAPPAWDVLGVPSQLAIAAGEEAIVFVTLAVPPDAAAGSYVLTLTATSAADPTDVASAGVATRVAARTEIELVPPGGQSVQRGASAVYVVDVANRGNVQDVVTVAAASSRGTPLAVDPPQLALSPRETRSVVVTVPVAPDAAPGRDVVTVRASSTLYPGTEDEVAIFTTILPPGPDDVPRSLVESLPVQVRVRVERDETADAFDSEIAFSSSGPVLDGTLSASALVDHPFGSAPLDVRSWLVGYRTEDAAFDLGGVSRALSDLQAMSATGASAALDRPTFDLALVAGGSAGETRFGGVLTLGPDEAHAGVSFTDARSESTRTAAWTGLAAIEPLDGWTLRAEGGMGLWGSKRGRAALFGTAIDTDAVTASAVVFSVDSFFPGPRHDTAGIETSQRLRLSEFALALALRHVWNNVASDPTAPTLVTDSLDAHLQATPWEDGPTLECALSLERRRQDGAAPRDEADVLVAYDVTETEGSLPYAFSGRVAERIDARLGTHERTLTHTQQVGLGLDAFTVRFVVEEEQVVDLAHDLVLRSAASASVALQPTGALHEASIDFRWAGTQLALDASVHLRVTANLGATLGATAEWDSSVPGSARFGWSLEGDVTFAMPAPFLVTKGSLAGHVFVDRDANGRPDPGEPPAGGVTLAVEGSEVSTAEDGAYRFPPLAAGVYSVAARDLPRGAASAGPIQVSVAAGEVATLDIPLVPILSVRGAVFEDGDQDGTRQPNEPGIAGIRVLLSDGAASGSATTDARGEFAFDDVRPGAYLATIDPASLPERFAFTTPDSLPADPSTGELLLFGGFIRPRPVVVTFQPPTADITFEPSAPRAGESVTFDASASFDFDGTIARFAWDFESDGVVDSSEAVAVHAFSAPGRVRVTLVVTDDAGNEDRKTVDLDVAAAAAPAEPETPELPATPPATGLARPPVAAFTYRPVAPKAEEAVSFDAAASVDFDGPIAAFAWDFESDGIADAEGRAADHSFPAPGTYRVSLTVVDASGLRDVAAVEVEIQAASSIVTVSPPELAARVRYEPQVARVGETVRFDASDSVRPGGAPLTYAWDFDADGSADARDAAAEWAFGAAGSHPIGLTVSMPDGRSSSLTLAIPVVAAAATDSTRPPVATLQFVPTRPNAGDPVMFSATASTDVDGRVVGYAWDFGADGLIDSTEPIAVRTFAASGRFAVRLIVYDDAGHSGAAETTVVVP